VAVGGGREARSVQVCVGTPRSAVATGSFILRISDWERMSVWFLVSGVLGVGGRRTIYGIKN
jgi:hypothetical protein